MTFSDAFFVRLFRVNAVKPVFKRSLKNGQNKGLNEKQ